MSSLNFQRVLPRFIAGSVIALLILLGEIHLNADSFEYAGFSQTYAKYIGIAVATVTAMLGITLSYIIRKKDWGKQSKILLSAGIILLVTGLYYTLGEIRVSMMNNQSNSPSEGLFSLTPFHFVVFNLSFFMAIFSVKYFIFPTPKMLAANEEHKTVSDKLKKAEKQLSVLQQAIRNAHTSRNKDIENIKQDFVARKRIVKEKISKISDTIKSSAVTFNEVLSRAQHFYTQVNNDYKTVATTFLSTLNLYRNDGISLASPVLKDLENPFVHYQSL